MDESKLQKVCRRCQMNFETRRSMQVYCSPYCRDEDYCEYAFHTASVQKVCLSCGVQFTTFVPRRHTLCHKCWVDDQEKEKQHLLLRRKVAEKIRLEEKVTKLARRKPQLTNQLTRVIEGRDEYQVSIGITPCSNPTVRFEDREIESENGICPVCGKRPANSPHHSRPRAEGGTDGDKNEIWLCETCHNVVEWVQEQMGLEYCPTVVREARRMLGLYEDRYHIPERGSRGGKHPKHRFYDLTAFSSYLGHGTFKERPKLPSTRGQYCYKVEQFLIFLAGREPSPKLAREFDRGASRWSHQYIPALKSYFRFRKESGILGAQDLEVPESTNHQAEALREKLREMREQLLSSTYTSSTAV